MNNDENLKTTISEKMVTKTTVLMELVLLITTCRVWNFNYDHLQEEEEQEMI